MKKTLLVFGLLSSAAMSFAQQRLILAESYSQASCGPCAAANPGFTTFLATNASKMVAIKYQVSWPGYDPMYNQNPTDIGARTSYYGVTGVPTRVMDGTIDALAAPTVPADQTTVDNRYAVTSPVSMTITHSIDPGFATADITVTITAPNTWNPSNTVLQLAMVEKQITFASAPGTNGETEFHNVMRKMYPSASGTPVIASNFSSAGGTQTFTFTNVTVPSYIYDLNQIGFIAWVQNNTTKEVYQAGVSEPIALADYAVVNNLTVPNDYSCSTDLTGAVAVLKNPGTTTITSATVNYKIDNGTVQTAPFTGSIAPNGTVNFNIPTVAVSSGSHTLTSYLTNINNSGISTAVGTATKSFARISAAGSTGQLVQNFSVSAFPYANYYVSSATNDNWVRSTANTGSLKYNNYSIASGKSGSVFIAPIDMSSISNHIMTFDVAYRQYSSNYSDGLEVFVSTDCGTNWASVYSKSGSGLSTGAVTTSSFTPTTSADWRNETVDLTGYATASKLNIKFVGTSDYGNNLYIDNINIGNLGVKEQAELSNFNIFPNPATDKLNVNFTAENTDYTVAITDVAGRVLTSNTYSNISGSQNIEVSLAGITAGNYIVTVSCENGAYNKKVVIK